MSIRHSNPHWILRITPERHRARVTRIGAVFGFVCSMIWTLAAFSGLFLGPLVYALWRPEAPLSRLVRRLYSAPGDDSSILIYSSVMIAIIGLIYSGHTFLNYVSQESKKA